MEYQKIAACTLLSVAALCAIHITIPARADSLKLSAKDTAVIVIDVQEDFTIDNKYKKEHRKGRLAVDNTGDPYIASVIEAIKKLKNLGYRIFATQDWHPKGHVSFASSHKGDKKIQTIKLPNGNTLKILALPDGRTQVLWPDHCVQFTTGADLLIPDKDLTAVIKKGSDLNYDSYSGFADDGGKETSLKKTLNRYNIKNLIIFGIATDYCVKATAIHGVERGYNVFVVTDLSRGVDPVTIAEAIKEMEKKGVMVVKKLNELTLSK